MHKYYRTLSGIALAAGLGAMVIAGTAHFARAEGSPQDAPAKKQKNYKDTAEYDAYNDVIKASNPMDAKKLLAALDAWTQKYPTTDYADERAYYYLQAYSGNNQPGKVLDTAKDLISGGIQGLKDRLTVPQYVLQTLFVSCAATSALVQAGTGTPDELATGTKAAQLLLDYGKEYFAADKKPANTPADQWAQGLKLVTDQANTTLLQVAMAPGMAIMKSNGGKPDPAACEQAEAAFTKALQDYPQNGAISYQLANAMRCQQTKTPDKAVQAIYEYARASVDPIGPGMDDATQKSIAKYTHDAYVQIHGSEDGLQDMLAAAGKSPLPPAGFHIKTKTEIALEKQEEFKSKNPQLAMWMGLKASLADTNGQQYFEGTLKDADVHGENGAKALKGTIVGSELKGKPAACRPDELLIAVPLPDAQGSSTPEIRLKFDAPLTGAPETGTEIQWDGVPTAFTKEPFMLTMETEKGKVEGLTLKPCAATAAPVRKTAPATAPPTKKK